MSAKIPVIGQAILIKSDKDLAKALAEGRETIKVSEKEGPEEKPEVSEEEPEVFDDFVERVKEMFPQFQLKPITLIQAMEAKELANYLQILKGYQAKMQQAAVQYKAQKEAREEQLKSLMVEIKEQLGVDSVEGLKELKDETLSQLNTAYDGLREFVEE